MSQPAHYLMVFRSCHGGSGQTALSAHVALGLARSGRQVLLIEEGVPGMARHYLQPGADLHLAPASSNGHQRVETLQSNLLYAAVPAATAEVIASLAAGRAGSGGQGPLQMSWIVVDASRSGADESELEADLELQVLRADPASLVNNPALAVADSPARFVVNQIDQRRPVSRDIDQVLSTLLGDRLLSRIHYDEAVPEALALRSNVFDAAPTSRAAAALTELVDAVMATEAQPEAIVASE